MNDKRWTMNHRPMICGMRNAERGTLSSTLSPRGLRLGRASGSERGGRDWWKIRNLQCGMTLIEVIMVMVIIGILAATVIPRFDFGTSSKASVDGAAYMIASDIRYAQECAMANMLSKSVSFTSGNSFYTFFATTPPTDGLDPSGRLPTGVRIDNDFRVTFNSLGEPSTVGGWSVTVSAGGLYPRTITVLNYTGKVNIS